MFTCVQSFSSKAAVQGIGLHALLAPDETAPRLLATAVGTYALEQFTAYATEAPQAQVGRPLLPCYEQTYYEDTTRHRRAATTYRRRAYMPCLPRRV
mgnify:CR=1 FL=1